MPNDRQNANNPSKDKQQSDRQHLPKNDQNKLGNKMGTRQNNQNKQRQEK